MIRKAELIAGICWVLFVYLIWSICFGFIPYYWDTLTKILYIGMSLISAPIAILFFMDFLKKDE